MTAQDPAHPPGQPTEEELQAAYAPERTFEFGLARLLDGIGALVERRAG